MLWLVPHLFAPARLVEAALHGRRLPGLETLVARGTLQPCSGDGTEGALCEALGIRREADWPIAPIAVEADGRRAGDAYWLRADPVHLHLMRDRIVLTDPSHLDLTVAEARELTDAIARHFGEAFAPLPLRPQRWYLSFPDALRLSTTPPSVATGRAIEPLLPRGEDSLRIRAQLNEVQMLLFDHPVNRAREARGALTVNAVWLWGGGHKPTTPAQPLSVYAADGVAGELARLAGAQVHARPGAYERSRIATRGVVVLDDLVSAGQVGDAPGWGEAIEKLERDWFLPLRNGLRRMGSGEVRVVDPVQGRMLRLSRAHAFRFWRRPAPLTLVTT